MADVLTYVLHYQGEFNKNSLGAVSEGAARAAEIGGQCHALVLGGDDLSDELCQSLGGYGATKVFRAKGSEGLAQPVVDVMAKVIDENGHSYALFGGGLLGFEIGAGLAARKHAGVTMEVTAVRAEDGKLVAERPILQDSKISVSRYKGDLGIIIGRINAFEVVERDGGAADVVDVDVEYSPWSTKATMVNRGEVPVAVIEKAKTCGGHNLSGAVMRPGPLQELFPEMTREDWRKEKFAFGEVTKESIYALPNSKVKVPVPVFAAPNFKNHGNEVISVAALARYQQAQ